MDTGDSEAIVNETMVVDGETDLMEEAEWSLTDRVGTIRVEDGLRVDVGDSDDMVTGTVDVDGETELTEETGWSVTDRDGTI